MKTNQTSYVRTAQASHDRTSGLRTSSQLTNASSVDLHARRVKVLAESSQTNGFPGSLLQEAPGIDDVLKKSIDEIWELYDADESGYLDKEEILKFIRGAIQGKPMDDAADESDDGADDPVKLSTAEIEACFRQFDQDGNGVILKDEMTEFIKLITGL